jgi:hypothetical protein
MGCDSALRDQVSDVFTRDGLLHIIDPFRIKPDAIEATF